MPIKNFYIILTLLFANTNTNAQLPKLAYLDRDYVVTLMPGFSQIDTLVAAFGRDTLGARFDSMVRELKKVDSFTRDCGDLHTRVDSGFRQRIEQLFYNIQNWQLYAQEQSQLKQTQLLQPFLNKVNEALEALIKERHYTYVFHKDALWYALPDDDLLFPLARKLGLQLPQQPIGPQQFPKLFYKAGDQNQ